MNVRTIGSLKEAREVVQEELEKTSQAKGWMVGIWCETHEGTLNLHRISFEFSNMLLEKALFLLANDLAEDKKRTEMPAETPLKRAVPINSMPLPMSKLFPAEFFPVESVEEEVESVENAVIEVE